MYVRSTAFGPVGIWKNGSSRSYGLIGDMETTVKTTFKKSAGNRVQVHTAAETLRKAPPKLLLDTLAAVVDSGAAVILAGTRDGSALVITLLDGDGKDKVYCEDMDDLREALTDLATAYTTQTP